jgi:hypothetical protein
MNLYRCKPTKKLALTDIQRTQRYEVALLWKDWGYKGWLKIVFWTREQFLLMNPVVFKTFLEHLTNDIILMLLNGGITIIQRLYFGVAFRTIIKGLVIYGKLVTKHPDT